jgi:hypothetical protein
MDHESVGRYWDENAEAWAELARAGYDHYPRSEALASISSQPS